LTVTKHLGPGPWSLLEVEEITLSLWCQTALLFCASCEPVEQFATRSSRSNYCEFLQESVGKDMAAWTGIWMFFIRMMYTSYDRVPLVQSHQVRYQVRHFRPGLETVRTQDRSVQWTDQTQILCIMW